MSAVLKPIEPTSLENESSYKGWVPKEWHPVYEEIVLLSANGMSNVEIALRYGVGKQHVSNIIRTPQAAIIRRQILDKLHERAMSSVGQRLEMIALKTVERLNTLVHDDDMFANHPFAIIDRGMKVVEGLKKIGGEKNQLDKANSSGVNIQNAVIISGTEISDIREGLEFSKKVLMAGKPDDSK